MRLTIDLPDHVGRELEHEANRHGVEAGQYALEVIQNNLNAVDQARKLKELFDQWDSEDETKDPQEIRRRQQEWESFKAALDANRSSGRKVFSE